MNAEKELLLTTKTDVITSITDMYSRLKAGALANLLIQSAIESADKLGFGFKNLKEIELFWVLNRLHIEIVKPIYRNENLMVETWPKTVDGWFYIRDFFIKNDKEEILVKATSSWLALDAKSKRPKKIDGLLAEKFTRLKEKNALPYLPEKLAESETNYSIEIKPSFFDFDLNGHVTSSRYIDWMMDCLSLDFHKNNYPKTMIINYLKETLPQLGVRMNHKFLENNKVFFEGKHTIKENTCVRALVEFEKILQ